MLQTVEHTIPGSTPVAQDVCTGTSEQGNRAAVPGPTTINSTHVAGEGCISEHVNRAGSQLKEQYLQLRCAHPTKWLL